MSDDYEAFVANKLTRVPPTGLATVPELGDYLFPHQRDLVGWALRRGRAAVFAGTGLGKSRISLEWARCVAEHTGGRVLLLTPLAVAPQMVREANAIGVRAAHVRDQESAPADCPIWVTNYERLHKFDAASFAGVVCDESSVIKHYNSKTFQTLMDAFRDTAWKLCATATPAPNDFTELGTHAELLGICTRTEMLAEYFIRDGGETQVWNLKGHAQKLFWRWVASWAALLRTPSDLGYDDGAYALPPLNLKQEIVAVDHGQQREAGMLFAVEARTLSERRNVRRASMTARVDRCVEIVRAEPGEQFVVWCDLNLEQDALAKALGKEAVSIQGSTDPDEKVEMHERWLRGEARVLISKPSIFGFGLHWAHCARMAFVGVSDSWESYFQAVRRCWRFGQTREVDVYVITGELEGAVTANLQRKEADAIRMSDELSAQTRDVVRTEVRGLKREVNDYVRPRLIMPSWLKGDAA
jgi:hypothetical protein